MRRRKVTLCGIGGSIILAAGAAFAQTPPPHVQPEFTLAQDYRGPEPGVLRKRPWLAASEIAGINILVWAYDRYIEFEPWAYIDWDTVVENLRRGIEWDRDEFSTNFFGHPFHGALFYNSARSSGLNFWEASAFTLGGTMMWEFFMENIPPSFNDLITTTTGGIHLGEALYRISSLVLDERATGFNRVWRELAAGLIDPARGLNRLITGESWRTRSLNRQVRAPLRGNVSFTRYFLAPWSDLGQVDQNVGLELDFVYGDAAADQTAYRPFDWFVFSSNLRFADERDFGEISSYALLAGQYRVGRKGSRYLTGLFQHFDYLVNEYFKMAGSSLTEGVVSTLNLKNGGRIGTSVQMGALFGASVNDYFLIEERDYTYGFGPVLKFDALFDLRKAGTINLRFSQFAIFTIAGTVHDATDNVNWVSQAQARYLLNLWSNIGVRLELGWFRRSTQYEQAQRITRNQVHLGLSAVYRF
jgi:hypothetical protein